MSSPWISFKLNLININLPRLTVHYPHFSSSISSMEFSLKCHSMYAYGDDWIINNYLISISILSIGITYVYNFTMKIPCCLSMTTMMMRIAIYLLILRLYRNARLTRLHNKLIFFCFLNERLNNTQWNFTGQYYKNLVLSNLKMPLEFSLQLDFFILYFHAIPHFLAIFVK